MITWTIQGLADLEDHFLRDAMTVCLDAWLEQLNDQEREQLAKAIYAQLQEFYATPVFEHVHHQRRRMLRMVPRLGKVASICWPQVEKIATLSGGSHVTYNPAMRLRAELVDASKRLLANRP